MAIEGSTPDHARRRVPDGDVRHRAARRATGARQVGAGQRQQCRERGAGAAAGPEAHGGGPHRQHCERRLPARGSGARHLLAARAAHRLPGVGDEFAAACSRWIVDTGAGDTGGALRVAGADGVRGQVALRRRARQRRRDGEVARSRPDDAGSCRGRLLGRGAEVQGADVAAHRASRRHAARLDAKPGAAPAERLAHQERRPREPAGMGLRARHVARPTQGGAGTQRGTGVLRPGRASAVHRLVPRLALLQPRQAQVEGRQPAHRPLQASEACRTRRPRGALRVRSRQPGAADARLRIREAARLGAGSRCGWGHALRAAGRRCLATSIMAHAGARTGRERRAGRLRVLRLRRDGRVRGGGDEARRHARRFGHGDAGGGARTAAAADGGTGHAGKQDSSG